MILIAKLASSPNGTLEIAAWTMLNFEVANSFQT